MAQSIPASPAAKTADGSGLFHVGELALRFSEIKYTYLVTPCPPRPAGLLVVMRTGSLFVLKEAGGDPCTWLKLETALRRRATGCHAQK